MIARAWHLQAGATRAAAGRQADRVRGGVGYEPLLIGGPGLRRRAVGVLRRVREQWPRPGRLEPSISGPWDRRGIGRCSRPSAIVPRILRLCRQGRPCASHQSLHLGAVVYTFIRGHEHDEYVP